MEIDRSIQNLCNVIVVLMTVPLNWCEAGGGGLRILWMMLIFTSY